MLHKNHIPKPNTKLNQQITKQKLDPNEKSPPRQKRAKRKRDCTIPEWR